MPTEHKYTIQEISNMFGVSPERIRQIVGEMLENDWQKFVERGKRNKFIISSKGLEYISYRLGKEPTGTNKDEQQTWSNVVETLRSELEEKNKIIAELMAQNKKQSEQIAVFLTQEQELRKNEQTLKAMEQQKILLENPRNKKPWWKLWGKRNVEEN